MIAQDRSAALVLVNTCPHFHTFVQTNLLDKLTRCLEVDEDVYMILQIQPVTNTFYSIDLFCLK